MKQISSLFVLMLISFSTVIYASEANENAYLIQMLNQLEALKPIIMAASKEQLSQSRIQFHYSAYRDRSGQLHNGLFDDITAIENGIKEQLNQKSIEPHRFTAIKGDYVNS